MKTNFDNKYLIAYLCDSKKIKDFMVLLNFYRFLCNLIYKTKDYKLYQIKLKWLIDQIPSSIKSNVEEVDAFKILIEKYSLDKNKILSMIEAKAIDMDNFPFFSQNDLLCYIEKTDVMFWNFYAQMLYDDSLTKTEIDSISNMARAFGILETIRFSNFKKSKSVYVLLYSKNDMKKIEKQEKENIKALLDLSDNYIKESFKNKRKIKKLLLLNYFSKNFIKNLKKVDYKVNDNSISDVSKITYLKIILVLIFRI